MPIVRDKRGVRLDRGLKWQNNCTEGINITLTHEKLEDFPGTLKLLAALERHSAHGIDSNIHMGSLR